MGQQEAGANPTWLWSQGWVHPGKGAKSLQGQTQRQTTSYTNNGQFIVVKSPYLNFPWTVGGNQHMHDGNMQTSHVKTPLVDPGIGPGTFML